MDNAPARWGGAKKLSRRRLFRQVRGAAAAVLLWPKVYLARASRPPRTLKPGVLRIGTYFVNPPFEFVSDRERTGFEFDLMKEISQRLDLHSEFTNTRWEVILREMQENRYDCIVGGITITPERQRLLAWSVPYMTTTLSLLVDAARSAVTMTLADLKGATVGVQAATTDYDAAVAMQQAGKIRLVKVYPFARISDAIADLIAGRIDAVMKVYPVAAWFVRETPGLRILAQIPDDPQPLGIGFSPNDTDLVTAVNRALAETQRSGRYEALARRWGLTPFGGRAPDHVARPWRTPKGFCHSGAHYEAAPDAPRAGRRYPDCGSGPAHDSGRNLRKAGLPEM